MLELISSVIICKMVEDSVGKSAVLIEGVRVTPGSVSDIPSDDGAKVSLDIFDIGNGDLAVWAHDLTFQAFSHPVRINNYVGGGAYPYIHEELVLGLLNNNFARTKGKVPSRFSSPTRRFDQFASYTQTQVIEGGEEDLFRLKVIDIEDLDNNSENFFPETSNLDIEVNKNGDVTLTAKHANPVVESQLSLLFKTAENGGKFPILAAVFTRIAERTHAAYLKRH